MLIQKATASNVTRRDRGADLEKLVAMVLGDLRAGPLKERCQLARETGVALLDDLEPEWFEDGKITWSDEQRAYVESLVGALEDAVGARLAPLPPAVPRRRGEADGPIRMRDLLATLAKRPAGESVRFDFGVFIPGEIMSYRGDYSHVALGYRDRERAAGETVSAFRDRLSASIGSKLEGWKGGGGLVRPETPIWVADSAGDLTHTALLGIVEYEGETVLATGFCS